MKTFLFILLISLAFLTSAFRQDRTNEKKWTIDPASWGYSIYRGGDCI